MILQNKKTVPPFLSVRFRRAHLEIMDVGLKVCPVEKCVLMKEVKEGNKGNLRIKRQEIPKFSEVKWHVHALG